MNDTEKLHAAKMTLLGKMAAKKQQHPVSEAQRRWAFAAEKRGELPRGKAHEWAKRVKGEHLPASTMSGKQGTVREVHRTAPPKPAKPPTSENQRSLEMARDYVHRRGARAAGLSRQEHQSLMGRQEPGQLRPRTPAPRVPAPVRPVQPQRRPFPGQRVPPRAVQPMRRSFVDEAGRPLKKGGIYTFRSYDPKRDAKLPDKYLFDYLCSFIEEAYEHEKNEPMHRKIEAKDLPASMARAIMGELVQTLPKNPNLMRACKKYNCTQDTIAQLLVAKGILKPRSDTVWTDSDGMRAMGAELLAEGEVMAYSKQQPWLQGEPAPRVGLQLAPRHVEDASSQVVDDHLDPALALAMRKSAEARMLWPESMETPAGATIADNCPVHGARDMTKSMNMWNPMQPCICKGKADAYG